VFERKITPLHTKGGGQKGKKTKQNIKNKDPDQPPSQVIMLDIHHPTKKKRKKGSFNRD